MTSSIYDYVIANVKCLVDKVLKKLQVYLGTHIISYIAIRHKGLRLLVLLLQDCIESQCNVICHNCKSITVNCLYDIKSWKPKWPLNYRCCFYDSYEVKALEL